MSGFPDIRSSSVSTAGYEDGLGRRSVRFNREVGGMLECLHLRPQFLTFERVLRQRAEELARLDDERFARIRNFEKDASGLTVVSELVAGHRLIDILETRQADDAAVSGIDAAFGFLLQAMPALAELHATRITHGVVAPGRIIITANSQVVLLDSIYGAAVERLNLSRRTLWTSYGIMAPSMAGTAPINPCADVAQVALCALLLAVGRPLDGRAELAALAPLVREVSELAEIRGGAAFAEGVSRFFATTLPVEGRRPTIASEEAAAEIRRLVSHVSEEESLNALAELVCFQPVARPAAPLTEEVSAPAPAAPAVPHVLAQPTPLEIEVPDVHAGIAPPPAVDVILPAAASQPAVVYVPAVHEPPPVSAPSPPVAEVVTASAAPEMPPPAEPRPTAIPVRPPVITAPAAARDFGPSVPLAPPPAPAVVPTPPALLSPQAAAPPPVQPQPPPILRIRQEAPKGYAPQRRLEPVLPPAPVPARALPFAGRGGPGDGGAVRWKLVAVAVIVITVGILAGWAARQGPSPSLGDVGTVEAAAAAAPAAVTGSLAIDSQPSGARVMLNGREVGLTPLTLDAVPTGRHQVTVTTGTASVQRAVRIDAGQHAVMSIPVFSGWIAVFAPIRLDVAEGSRSLGSTETGRILLSPGRHVLTLSNGEFGFSTSETVDIRPGEERTLNIRPTGRVNLNASPWAEVWVDGTRAGETPLANLEVALGTREFVFKHPQYGERRLTATVTTRAAALSVDFSRPPSSY